MREVGALFCLLSAGCVPAAQLNAQPQPDPEALTALEARIDAGRLDGARRSVENWLAAADDPPPEALGRARYLRARLMTDVDSARAEYLAVALDGRSSYGASAWLRLAQLDLTVGEPVRATADLERLRADYPGGAVWTESWYWSARSLEARGLLVEACRTYERAITEARRIGEGSVIERAVSASRACGSGGLRFTIQVGAFSRASAAREMEAQLEREGFPTRVFEEEGLHRVRVGFFASPETARALERRLRDGGFTVAVVAAES